MFILVFLFSFNPNLNYCGLFLDCVYGNSEVYFNRGQTAKTTKRPTIIWIPLWKMEW